MLANFKKMFAKIIEMATNTIHINPQPKKMFAEFKTNVCKNSFFSQTLYKSPSLHHPPSLDCFFEKKTIFITTTHNTHGKFFYEVLQKKNNIYIEKPLSTSRKNLIKIQKFLEKKITHVFYVGYNRRFSSLNDDIISKIKNVGPVFINYNINASITDLSHWTSNENDGGRLIGEVCHFIDYCSFILDSEIVNWKCTHLNNLNDNLVISLNYSNGSSANINYITSGCDSFPKENIFFHFEKKIINLIDFKKVEYYGFSLFKKSKKLFNQDKGQKKMIDSFISDIQNNIIDRVNINKIIKECLILLDIKDEINNS